MNNTEISLYFNELRLKAVKSALAQEGFTIEDKLNESINFLYEQLVSYEQQTAIEAQIEKINEAERAEREAKRCFAVFHVRENKSEAYFTSEHFSSFRAAAYRYRLYDRGELDAEPQRLADAFIGNDAINAAEYEYLCDRMPNDFRITALIDFDLDNETVSVCDGSNNAWRSYRLHDLSVAAFKAYRGDHYSAEYRERIFSSALSGKEIDIEAEVLSEIEPPTMQM